MLAFPNRSLASVTAVAGKMGGAWVNNGTPLDGTVYFFKRSGETATYQLQAIDGAYTKCVKVELSQSDTDIVARVLYAKYINAPNSGFDFDTGGATNTVATSAGALGYGATATRLLFGAASTGVVQLGGTNSYRGNTEVVDATLELTVGASLAFHVTDSSVNTLTGDGNVVLNGGFVVDVSAVTRNSGTWLLENVTSLSWAYGPSFKVTSPDGTAWADLGADKWRMDSALLRFTFDETTGILSVEPVDFSSWRETNAPGQALADDHDHDGVPNGVEYFMGLAGDGFTANPVPDVARLVSWPKGKGYAGIYGDDYLLQFSDELVTWDDVPSGGVIIANASVEYILPDDSPKKFVRLNVSGR